MNRVSSLSMKPTLPTLFSLALALSLALVACAGDAVTACASNDDCREGFVCGTGPFAGECVQFVQVQPCGAGYCERNRETCVDNACVPIGAGRDVNLQPPPAADVGPADPDDGVPPTLDAGPAADVAVPVDADPAVRPPRLLIDNPIDGSVYIDQQVVLEGQVLDLAARARVTWSIDSDPTPRLIDTPGAPLETRFRAVLDLPPGRHRLTVSVEQGGYTDEASVEFRADWFVRAQGNQLRLNERPWRFVGLSTPDLRELAWQHVNQGGTDRVAELLGEARRLGARVLRVPACDDRLGSPTAIQTARGTYNESGLVALDWVVTRAGEAGLKVILPLVDGTDQLGGVTQYLKWGGYLAPVPTDRRLFIQPGGIREHFKQYVRDLLARRNSVTGIAYADDPTILGYEVFTRFDAQGLYTAQGGGAEVADFFTDVTQIIQSAAPNALVGTGETGFDVSGAAYGRAAEELTAAGLGRAFDGTDGLSWQRNLRLGTVDFGSLEMLPDRLGLPADAGQWASLGAAWVRGHASLAGITGKPMIVSLAGVPRTLLDPAARAAALDAWLDEAAAQGASGVVVGHLRSDGFDAAADPLGFSWVNDSDPADPRNEPVLATVQRAAQSL